MELKRKAIRVGIAVSLCMLVSNLFKLRFPFFVLLPAVMPISTFFGETIKFGINRIIGSTIGAIIGILLSTIQQGDVLLVAVGVILIVYVCNYFKWDSTTSIACLVFVAIIVGAKGTSPLEYSIHRLLDTFIGIGITTLVNNYIFNPNLSQILKRQGKNIQEDLLNIANNKNFIENKNELNNIELQLNNMKEKFKIYTEEFKGASKHNSTKSKLENVIDILTITFDQIKIINYINTTNEYSTKGVLTNTELLINYHKNMFFNEMENLNKIIDDIVY